MRPDTIAVIVICALALGYFIHRTLKSFRGGATCGCGCDGCGDRAPKTSKTAPQCPGRGNGADAPSPGSPLDQRDDLR